jgi:AcrR family transcriptional regulator
MRQSILETALQLSRERGLHELSMREIARRVDYSPAGLYRYFESKEAIVAALALEANQCLCAQLKTVPSDLPPRERLVELGLAYLTFARKSPAHFTLFFSELPSSRSSFAEAVVPESPYSILLDAVQEGVKAGDLAMLGEEDEVEKMAYCIWSLAHGMAVLEQSHLQNFRTDFNAGHRYALERVVSGFLRNGLEK